MGETIPEDLAELWLHLLGEKPSKSSENSSRYNKKVKLLNFLPEKIRQGKEGAEFSRENLDDILSQFRAKEPQVYLFLVRFLARGLEKGNRTLNWNVAVPSVPQKIPRERARFTPQAFAELQKLRRIEDVLLCSFSRDAEFKTEHIYGRLILSAVIYGGLLESEWLHPFAVAVNDRTYVDGCTLWLELERPWINLHKRNNQENQKAEAPVMMYHRWFADPISKILIVRWRELVAERNYRNSKPNVFNLVRGFMAAAGVQRLDIPEKISNLLDMAETRLGLTVLPFVASYASGWLKGVSVPRETWVRLCSGKIVEKKPFGLENDDPPLLSGSILTVSIAATPAPLNEQQLLLREMQRIFSKHKGFDKSKSQLRSELAEFTERTQSSLCPILALLALWVEKYLAVESRYSPATPKRYLGAVGKILLAIFGHDNLLELEAEDFIESYDRAVEVVDSEKERGVARRTIGRFHNYLVRHHGAPQLMQGVFQDRSGPPEVTVNANLVTQMEFDRIKDILGWGNGNRPRTATATILIAIFGFRCGLRRNEVHKLRVHDIQGHVNPELLLRATAKRRLKSAHATRRLPLYLLFTKEEMQLLESWLQQFGNSPRETLLFCADPVDKPQELIPEMLLFSRINESMAMATGDHTLHFHHLRHSFANWLIIRLTGHIANLRKTAPFLDHPEFSEDRIRDLRAFLLGNEHLGRKGAYAVSCLLGHADLKTTFTSYVHLCDWLLGRELTMLAEPPSLDVETLVWLTGLSRATVYRVCKTREDAFQENLEILFDKTLKRYDQYRDPLFLQAREPLIQQPDLLDKLPYIPLWQTVRKALRLYQENQKSVSEIANLLQLSIDLIDKWVSKADAIKCMRHKSGKSDANKSMCHKSVKPDTRFRHVVTRNRPVGTRTTVRKKDQAVVIQCRHRNRSRQHIFPMQPVEEGDKMLAEMMLNKFETLSADQKSLVLDAVDYFLEKYSVHKGIIAFSGTRQARNFVTAIRHLKVQDDSIQLVDLSGKNNDDALTRKTVWEHALGLQNASWGSSNRGYGSSKFPGSIGIRVISTKRQKKPEGSYGFRYALYLIAIAYWG